LKRIFLVITILFTTFLFASEKRVQYYYADISAKEAFKLHSDGVVLIDVRTKGEYDRLHPKGAILLPLFFEKFGKRVENKQFVSQVNELVKSKKDTPIILICRSGSRTHYGSNLLAVNGFTKVYNIKYGFAYDWMRQRLPVSK
jgi:rhodanese-related sulfurtransferase